MFSTIHKVQRRLLLTVQAASLLALSNTVALATCSVDGYGQGRVLPSKPVPFNDLAIGDVVFIRIDVKPFREVAAVTDTWTNHVGVVVSIDGEEPLIAESTFPFSRETTLAKFIRRSQDGRFAIARLKAPLSQLQRQGIVYAAQRRYGVFYDTGFDIHSRRQFCSRFVREVIAEASGVELGEVESFQTLFASHPNANLGFWKVWYFGRIPWTRETITPASLLRSAELRILYDGSAANLATPGSRSGGE